MARLSLTYGPGALAAGVGAVALAVGAVYLVVSPEESAVPLVPTAQEEAPRDTETASTTATDPATGGAPPAPDAAGEATAASEVEAEEPAKVASLPEEPQGNDSAEVPGPRFDLVRAEASGQVLVAGRAAAGHEVRVSVDGVGMAEGDADGAGGFVLFLDLPLTDKPRVLDLLAIGPDGTERRAEDSVILAPPARAQDVVEDAVAGVPGGSAPEIPQPAEEAVAMAVAPSQSEANAALPEAASAAPSGERLSGSETSDPTAPSAAESREAVAVAVTPGAEETAQDSAERALTGTVPAEELAGGGRDTASPGVPALTVPENVAPSSTPDSVSASSAPAPEQAAEARAPSVLIARQEGVSLLQPSGGAAPLDRVVIDVISYDEQGAVILEGRSAAPPPPIDSVRIYLNNAPIQTTRIDEDGSWRLPLEGVASGLYTLRVDQLDAAGNVVSRFETPFKREDPLELARLEAERPRADESLAISVITVQPGYTLWGIASDRYGDGFRYVAIFDANAEQIRDPDLIFPGQIFDLPEIE